VVHPYAASEDLISFFKNLDPTNYFNSGIDLTTLLADWQDSGELGGGEVRDSGAPGRSGNPVQKTMNCSVSAQRSLANTPNGTPS
jgi:hypothetical protein